MLKFVIFLSLGWGVAISGCGSGGPEDGSMGTYGGPCRSDGSCDEGLTCTYHVCRNE